MRVLAIDFGLKKLGLALSDPSGKLAFPREVMARVSREQDLERLETLVRDESVAALVMGVALGPDGSETERSRQARNFANKLAHRTGLDVHYVDERLTSQEAKALLREAGVHGAKKRAQALDAQAAALILETYLQSASTPEEDLPGGGP